MSNVPSLAPEAYAASHTHLIDRATGRSASAFTPPEDVVDLSPLAWSFVTVAITTRSGADYVIVKRTGQPTVIARQGVGYSGDLSVDALGRVVLMDGDTLVVQSTTVQHIHVLEN